MDAASRQLGLLTAAQLSDLGVHRSTLSRSDQLGGMFTRVLPGVHSVHGPRRLSAEQRDMAAVLYAGDDSIISGIGPLRRRPMRSASSPAFGPDDRVHVLVPAERRRISTDFVVIERTVALPPYRISNGMPYAPVARQVLDAARRCVDEDAVRALVFEAVQRELTSCDSLDRERRRGQVRGSRFVRLALDEVYAGVRSVPEADLRAAFVARGINDLLFNPRLEDLSGELIGYPDVYHRSGVCLEVDSREHHFSVQGWETTMRRHARMTARGLAVLHVPPSRTRREVDAVIDEFLEAVETRSRSLPPRLRVRSVEFTPGAAE